MLAGNGLFKEALVNPLQHHLWQGTIDLILCITTQDAGIAR